MKPYSCGFREKIIAAYRHGQGSLRKIAKRFSVSTATVWLLWQRYLATGSVNPKPHTGGRDSVMTPYRLEVLRGLVKEKNDSTLEELRDKFHEATGLHMSCQGRDRQRPCSSWNVSAPEAQPNPSTASLIKALARSLTACPGWIPSASSRGDVPANQVSKPRSSRMDSSSR